VAGFLLVRLGHIPTVGESVHHRGFLLEVTEMRGAKIERLKVTRVSTPVAGEDR
jgi:CBS domain containing-hemolysin-like protein